ncbi:hypothetical protein D9615_009882 [Tricholomella constricta]|uniref:Uncharacterized protein n=1 Tax=Tricholomella constricta TaxID=117010 RepID=A0A8H5LWK6_9AGAR|nr:hypothetical protein D9615_009882 [Tricholomella constricta]
MFDSHLYVPVPGSEDAPGAFHFFNSGEPLEAPYTYFVTAQASTAPLSSCAQLTLSSLFEPLHRFPFVRKGPGHTTFDTTQIQLLWLSIFPIFSW